ncbi:unnamed protein product [Pedinophyceae sp. YPF-701]|nr:unnamed protein product [Pedinophyceae sp. YPF-701]
MGGPARPRSRSKSLKDDSRGSDTGEDAGRGPPSRGAQRSGGDAKTDAGSKKRPRKAEEAKATDQSAQGNRPKRSRKQVEHFDPGKVLAQPQYATGLRMSKARKSDAASPRVDARPAPAPAGGVKQAAAAAKPHVPDSDDDEVHRNAGLGHSPQPPPHEPAPLAAQQTAPPEAGAKEPAAKARRKSVPSSSVDTGGDARIASSAGAPAEAGRKAVRGRGRGGAEKRPGAASRRGRGGRRAAAPAQRDPAAKPTRASLARQASGQQAQQQGQGGASREARGSDGDANGSAPARGASSKEDAGESEEEEERATLPPVQRPRGAAEVAARAGPALTASESEGASEEESESAPESTSGSESWRDEGSRRGGRGGAASSARGSSEVAKRRATQARRASGAAAGAAAKGGVSSPDSNEDADAVVATRGKGAVKAIPGSPSSSGSEQPVRAPHPPAARPQSSPALDISTTPTDHGAASPSPAPSHPARTAASERDAPAAAPKPAAEPAAAMEVCLVDVVPQQVPLAPPAGPSAANGTRPGLSAAGDGGAKRTDAAALPPQGNPPPAGGAAPPRTAAPRPAQGTPAAAPANMPARPAPAPAAPTASAQKQDLGGKPPATAAERRTSDTGTPAPGAPRPATAERQAPRPAARPPQSTPPAAAPRPPAKFKLQGMLSAIKGGSETVRGGPTKATAAPPARPAMPPRPQARPAAPAPAPKAPSGVTVTEEERKALNHLKVKVKEKRKSAAAPGSGAGEAGPAAPAPVAPPKRWTREDPQPLLDADDNSLAYHTGNLVSYLWGFAAKDSRARQQSTKSALDSCITHAEQKGFVDKAMDTIVAAMDDKPREMGESWNKQRHLMDFVPSLLASAAVRGPGSCAAQLLPDAIMRTWPKILDAALRREIPAAAERMRKVCKSLLGDLHRRAANGDDAMREALRAQLERMAEIAERKVPAQTIQRSAGACRMYRGPMVGGGELEQYAPVPQLFTQMTSRDMVETMRRHGYTLREGVLPIEELLSPPDGTTAPCWRPGPCAGDIEHGDLRTPWPSGFILQPQDAADTREIPGRSPDSSPWTAMRAKSPAPEAGPAGDAGGRRAEKEPKSDARRRVTIEKEEVRHGAPRARGESPRRGRGGGDGERPRPGGRRRGSSRCGRRTGRGGAAAAAAAPATAAWAPARARRPAQSVAGAVRRRDQAFAPRP